MPGIAVKAAVKPVSGGNGPGGRMLERGEMVPLSPEQSERLAVLFEKYGDRLVRYAHRKLTNRGLSAGDARALAEDIAQEAWVTVARTGARDLLREEPLSQDEALPMLFARVKTEISAHYKRSMSAEQPVDWQDAVTCNTLCPLLPSGCAMAALPGYLARMVAALPQEERRALLLKLDGLPLRQMGEHLGCSTHTADRLAERGLLLLQIDNPELSGEPVAVGTLPLWERRALAELSAVQQAVLLRLNDLARRVLLLLNTGLSITEAAKRLGVARNRVLAASGCFTVVRELTADDMEKAA